MAAAKNTGVHPDVKKMFNNFRTCLAHSLSVRQELNELFTAGEKELTDLFSKQNKTAIFIEVLRRLTERTPDLSMKEKIIDLVLLIERNEKDQANAEDPKNENTQYLKTPDDFLARL